MTVGRHHGPVDVCECARRRGGCRWYRVGLVMEVPDNAIHAVDEVDVFAQCLGQDNPHPFEDRNLQWQQASFPQLALKVVLWIASRSPSTVASGGKVGKS